MRESWGFLRNLKGTMKVKASLRSALGRIPGLFKAAGAHYRPVPSTSLVGRSKSVHVGTRKMVNYA